MRPDGGRQPFCVEPCSWPTTTGVTAWSDWPQWTDFPEEHQPLLVDPGRAWQTMYKRFAAIRSGCFAREFQAFLQSPEGSADARPETLFATDPNPVPEKVYRIHRDRVQSSSASTTPTCTWA